MTHQELIADCARAQIILLDVLTGRKCSLQECIQHVGRKPTCIAALETLVALGIAWQTCEPGNRRKISWTIEP
jgi:hypothetical protein